MQIGNVIKRLGLNSHYLSELNLAKMQLMIQTGCLRINLPEEGTLLIIPSALPAKYRRKNPGTFGRSLNLAAAAFVVLPTNGSPQTMAEPKNNGTAKGRSERPD